MTTGKSDMPLNIQAVDDSNFPNLPAKPHIRPNYGHNIENDLNAPARADSIEDNTRIPGYRPNIPTSQRTLRRGRRYTLSSIEKDLEEAKLCIEANIESKLNESHGANSKNSERDRFLLRKSSQQTGETQHKLLYTSEEDRHSGSDRSEKIYHRYVQEGERNLMLIYESKETKSEVYCKQIGNKNIMVHLNINSNLCQLIDTANKGIIPLDSEGAVWLEIKRRSQVFKTSNQCDMSSAGLSDNNSGTPSKHPSDEPIIIHRLQGSYRKGRVARNSPTEHSDKYYDNTEAEFHYNENDEAENNYDTISIKERAGSLSIKVEKWGQHDVLNVEDLQNSPIFSHKKVLDFLIDEGNDFDVSICDWEYEKESVYSYISSLQNGDNIVMDGPYTELTRNIQHPQRELDEDYASTFGYSLHGSCDEGRHESDYITPEDLVDAKDRTNETDLYDVPSKPHYTKPHQQPVGSDNSRPPIPNRNHKEKYDDILRSKSLPDEPNMRVHNEISRNPDYRAISPTEHSDSGSPKPPLPPKPRSSDPENYCIVPLNYLEDDLPSMTTMLPNPEKPNEPIKEKKKERKKKLIPPPPGKTDLGQRNWYHGKLETDVAKQRLKGKAHGSFLVRDAAGSSDTAHEYTIEFIDDGCVKKLMIMKTCKKYHFKEFEDKKFDRVEQLIQTIISSGLEVKDSDTQQWKNIKVKPVPH